MATIKAYTDLEQSKKLVEILPIESANMYYQYVLPKSDKIKLSPEIGNPINALEWYNKGYTFSGKEPIKLDEYCVPCWSLAALLDVLRIFTTPTAFSTKVSAPSLIKTENSYKLTYTGDYTLMINNGLDVETPIESIADNPIDACVDMIEKLHKQNLL